MSPFQAAFFLAVPGLLRCRVKAAETFCTGWWAKHSSRAQ